MLNQLKEKRQKLRIMRMENRELMILRQKTKTFQARSRGRRLRMEMVREKKLPWMRRQQTLLQRRMTCDGNRSSVMNKQYTSVQIFITQSVLNKLTSQSNQIFFIRTSVQINGKMQRLIDTAKYQIFSLNNVWLSREAIKEAAMQPDPD